MTDKKTGSSAAVHAAVVGITVLMVAIPTAIVAWIGPWLLYGSGLAALLGALLVAGSGAWFKEAVSDAASIEGNLTGSAFAFGALWGCSEWRVELAWIAGTAYCAGFLWLTFYDVVVDASKKAYHELTTGMSVACVLAAVVAAFGATWMLTGFGVPMIWNAAALTGLGLGRSLVAIAARRAKIGR